ncbi:MAG TPA: hypothetical protein VHB77_11615, partial [Planctomycetaceae bacterium]|nr:hypothetical protein [Planctomycetaceae bacterium]
MAAFLSFVFINAIVATPLAVLSWMIGRWLQRPAITHLLWVLVLLKLVTPSPFRLPAALELPTLTAMSDNAPELEWTLAGAESPTSAQIGSSTSVTASGTTNSTIRTSSPAGPVANPRWTSIKRVRLWPLLAAVWLMGSVCWFAVQIARGLRFR